MRSEYRRASNRERRVTGGRIRYSVIVQYGMVRVAIRSTKVVMANNGGKGRKEGHNYMKPNIYPLG